MLAPLRQVLLFQMYLSSFLVVETTFTNGTDVPNHFGEHVGSRTLSSGPLAMARHLQGCSCQDGCTVLGLVDSRCFFYMYSLPLVLGQESQMSILNAGLLFLRGHDANLSHLRDPFINFAASSSRTRHAPMIITATSTSR